jgi:hypothetical protein
MYNSAGMPAPVQEPSRPDDRYEPLPGIAGLPGWVWRRLPRAGKIGVALIPFLLIALALALAPGIDRSKDERAQMESERQTRLRAEQDARIRAEQRPRLGRGTVAGTDVGRRTTLLEEARAGVEVDARRRVAAGSLDGPVVRVDCEPFPRSVAAGGAHLDPGRDSGRYACLAITREVPAGRRAEASAIGHPYRLRIDFARGRYALCKVTGRPGEGSLGAQPRVTVPQVCGGA